MLVEDAVSSIEVAWRRSLVIRLRTLRISSSVSDRLVWYAWDFEWSQRLEGDEQHDEEQRGRDAELDEGHTGLAGAPLRSTGSWTV